MDRSLRDILALESQAALARLKTARAGLSAGEAAERRRIFGPNTVERVTGEPVWMRLGRGFVHFFALMLWVAAGLAFFAELRQPGQGMGELGGAIVGVVVVNGLFAFWQDYKAERVLAALTRLIPRQVKTVRDGTVALLETADLVPGDIVLLAAGDSVPADCRLIEAFGVRVNNANVTGESVAQARDAAPAESRDILQSRNLVLAGTMLVSGDATAVVVATGARTEFGKIANLTQRTAGVRSPLLNEIAFVSKVVGLLATVLGLVFFAVGMRLQLPFWENFLFAIGIIVANVPEGLLPTVTLALAMGAQRMARRNVLIRHLPAVETLGSATVICTDKTGTLTQNRMTVRELYVAGGLVSIDRVVVSPALAARAAEIAGHCHTLKRAGKGGEWLGDPTDIALVEVAQACVPACPPPLAYPRRAEIPFDADRRRISTVHDTPEGAMLYTKGAPESVLPLATRVAAEGTVVPLTPSARDRLAAAVETMAGRGLRVLALAYRPLAPEELSEITEARESELVLAGLVGLRDPPRPGVAEAVAAARAAGIRVVVITGDHPHTTVALAREIGLVTSADPMVVTGEGLRAFSPAKLASIAKAPELIFARIAADQKLLIVRALRALGEVVAATGDGVNDAPAIKEADVGIAMGRSGTDVAREAADMILLDDDFASIVAGIEEGRAVYDNIRKFMTYILSSNIPEIVPYLAFVLFGVPLGLTVIQMLAVDLGTDMVPALALGAEAPDPASMRRPPRPRARRLLDAALLARAYLWLGPMEAVAAMAAFFFVLWGGGWSLGEALGRAEPLYREATTACLTAIVVMQIANLFLCRSEGKSLAAVPLAGNRLIWAGIAAELSLLLAIAYTGLGQALFGTAAVSWRVWLFALPFAAVMIAAEETRKWLVARGDGPSSRR